MTDDQLTTDKINPYEYQVTTARPEFIGRHVDGQTIQILSDDLYEEGWEFIGLSDGKLISRRLRCNV